MIALKLPKWLPAWPTRWPALVAVRDFFAYHGIWAVGIRLLRRMSIGAKVFLVLSIMATPLVPLSWHVIGQALVEVRAMQQHVSAVRLSVAAQSLADTLNEGALVAERNGAPVPAEVAQRAFQRLEQAYAAASDAGLPVQQAWERDRPPLEAVVYTHPQARETRRGLNIDALSAINRLRQAVASAANVGATGDVALHVRADLLMYALPQLIQGMQQVYEVARRPMPGDATGAQRQAWLLELAGAGALARQDLSQARIRLSQMPGHPADAPPALPSVARFFELAAAQPLVHESELGDRTPLVAAYRAAIDDTARMYRELGAAVDQRLSERVESARALRDAMIAAMAVSCAIAVYLLYSFLLVIRGGLEQLHLQMKRLASGDLNARLRPHGADEVALTMQAMTSALQRVSELLSTVHGGATAVAQASRQVANGNGDLSERNRTAAQNVARVVDGVTQTRSQLDECARQAEKAVGIVTALRLESSRNRKQMQRLLDRMDRLRHSSREIGEVVRLIDAVASRTNILALNASVEAAKAGVSGRGFAVVAQEVRALALRGADSARRISEIVDRSTQDIEFGCELAAETGRALLATDEHVDRIGGAMDDVARLTLSGERQSAEILEQVVAIRGGVDENQGLVEQLSNASSALLAQSERLTRSVSRFRLS